MDYGKSDSIAKPARAAWIATLGMVLLATATLSAQSELPGPANGPVGTQAIPASDQGSDPNVQPKTQVVQFGEIQNEPAPKVIGSVSVESSPGSPASQTEQPVIQQPVIQQPVGQAKPAAALPQLSEFDAEAAFGYMADICKIGPRPSASPGMKKQQKYIRAHFEAIGGQYLEQAFKVKSPYDGRQVSLQNILIRWHPERVKRLLICCHHDTRPFADADPKNPRAKFIGANDGASGVALLCELGKHIGAMNGEYGIDFMFFDGEEFVIVRQRDPMFLGSRFFSQKYIEGVPSWRYEQAVLVDMVGDKDLQIHLEGNSMKFAPGLTQDIWAVAQKLGVKEFIPEQKQFIRDDHLALNEIAKIPTCDIIDFDFPNPTQGNVFWHTREDKLENCSAESLGKVGSVVLAWIRQKQQLAQGK